jgi:hypothetical protein
MNAKQRKRLADRLCKVAKEEAARGAAEVAALFRQQGAAVLAGVNYSVSWAREAKRSSWRVIKAPRRARQKTTSSHDEVDKRVGRDGKPRKSRAVRKAPYTSSP